MAEILLVHGGWHGPWCWDAFAARLAARGHRVHAAQLRGHDRRPGRLWYRVRDYIQDLEQAVATFERPPLLVGHSLGGLVVQKYLERNPGPGAVLMATVPPGGSIKAVWRLFRHHPLAFLKATISMSLRPFISRPEQVLELFFTPSRPRAVAERLMESLQDESYLAFIDTILFELPRPRRVRAPVLVLGAERDGIITVREVEKTARAYGTQAEIFAGIGHDMMLDDGWQAVADRVDVWARDPLG
jgi:pimeloyl-ACP methyl ester carboxylesterase